jgi:replicative DNA helicase
MKLSAPIHVLKSQAKSLKKLESISMTEALNKIASQEGYSSWSLLHSKSSDILPNSYNEILDYINPADLVVTASRPGFGKTSFTIGLFTKEILAKNQINFYFTLTETHKDFAARISAYDETLGEHNPFFDLDYSDEICADYIIKKVEQRVKKNSLIVIDYLQILDEKRSHPPIEDQIIKLKAFAKETGCRIIFLSQIKRDVELRNDRRPSINDIRLPNPLNLNLINKFIFLHRETSESKEVEVLFSNKTAHKFVMNWSDIKMNKPKNFT